MFNSETLEIAIGVVFVFLVASLATSAIREIIEGFLKTRAVQLEQGIRLLLDDPGGNKITRELFEHPLLDSLFDGKYHPDSDLRGFRLGKFRRVVGLPQSHSGKRLILGSTLPSYIPSRNFALALMDLVGKSADASGPLSLQNIMAGAAALPEGHVKQAVLVALGEAKGDLDRARTSLEAWYDGTMDRVSGWYKRETQVVLFFLGLLIAVLFNINSIDIARELASNNSVRTQLISQLEESYRSLPEGSSSITEKQIADIIGGKLSTAEDGLSGLIGWSSSSEEQKKASDLPWVWHIVGWLITAGAVSLGAPFWFDALNKLMIIRSTVKPYEKSPSEGSEDRQGGTPSADQLAPSPNPNAGMPLGGAPASAPPVGAEGPDDPSLARIRLAINLDGVEPSSATLSVDGNPSPVPADGFVELPLAVDVPHSISVEGERNGAAVRWQTSLIPSLNDEAIPLVADLREGS